MDRQENLFLPESKNLINDRVRSSGPFVALERFKALIALIFVDSNGAKKKREIRLAISCVLVILGSVFLMNLETPRRLSVPKAEGVASTPAPADVKPVVKKVPLSSSETTLPVAEMKGLAVPVARFVLCPAFGRKSTPGHRHYGPAGDARSGRD
jgi:hypothetical protein